MGAVGEEHSDTMLNSSWWTPPPPSCFECICDPHQRLDGPFASLMEKIMSKTNDTSYGAAATNEPTRELTADELIKSAGGYPEHSQFPRRPPMLP